MFGVKLKFFSRRREIVKNEKKIPLEKSSLDELLFPNHRRPLEVKVFCVVCVTRLWVSPKRACFSLIFTIYISIFLCSSGKLFILKARTGKGEVVSLGLQVPFKYLKATLLGREWSFSVQTWDQDLGSVVWWTRSLQTPPASVLCCYWTYWFALNSLTVAFPSHSVLRHDVRVCKQSKLLF